MSDCVRILPHGASLGFDLTDLVAAIGDQSHLEWEIAGVYVLAPMPPTGELWTYGAEDAFVTWPALVALAQTWCQVIDGTFTGRLQSGSVELTMSAVDSSFWTVSANDSTVIDRIRNSFDHVVDVRPDEA